MLLRKGLVDARDESRESLGESGGPQMGCAPCPTPALEQERAGISDSGPSSSDPAFGHQPTFIKMIPPMIMTAAAILAGLALSPRRARPNAKAPTDPIPVQTT